MAPTKGSGFAFHLQSAHPSFVHASSILELQPPLMAIHSKEKKMQKHIYLKRC